MWEHVEGSNIRPAETDTTSSKKYVYVRKNITFFEATEDRGEHYEWDEQKVDKSDWAIFKQVLEHDGAFDDVYAALTELAGLIG